MEEAVRRLVDDGTARVLLRMDLMNEEANVYVPCVVALYIEF